MPYKISGELSDNARIIVIKEDDWSIESNTEETAGNYNQLTLESGKKMIIAREYSGDVLAFGNVDSVYYEPPEKGYVYAGGTSGNPIQDTDEYSLDTWTEKANCPAPARQHHAGCTIEDKGYIFGGWDGGESDINDTDEYDPDTNSWVSKANLPKVSLNVEDRSSMGSTSINNKGYIFGGIVGENQSPSVMGNTEEYTPSSNTWSGKTNIPGVGRAYLAACTLSNNGYIFAGKSVNGSGYKYTARYNPDTWTTRTDMPDPGRHSLAACPIDGKGYVFGGRVGETAAIWDTDEYNPDTNSWSEKTNTPSPNRFGLASTAISNKGYIFGGHNTRPDTDEYTPDTWTNRTNMPSGRDYFPASTI